MSRPLPEHMQCFVRGEAYMMLHEALYYAGCGYDMEWYFNRPERTNSSGVSPELPRDE